MATTSIRLTLSIKTYKLNGEINAGLKNEIKIEPSIITKPSPNQSFLSRLLMTQLNF